MTTTIKPVRSAVSKGKFNPTEFGRFVGRRTKELLHERDARIDRLTVQVTELGKHLISTVNAMQVINAEIEAMRADLEEAKKR